MKLASFAFAALLVVIGFAGPSMGQRPYWANMGDFTEVMTGVSDASVFIDLMKAAGMDPSGASGTLIIPINDALAAGLAARGITPGALAATPAAAAALVGYHMSGQLVLESSPPASIATNYAGKALTVGGGPVFSGDSGSAKKKVVYYVGASAQALSAAVYLVDNLLIPAGFDLTAAGAMGGGAGGASNLNLAQMAAAAGTSSNLNLAQMAAAAGQLANTTVATGMELVANATDAITATATDNSTVTSNQTSTVVASPLPSPSPKAFTTSPAPAATTTTSKATEQTTANTLSTNTNTTSSAPAPAPATRANSGAAAVPVTLAALMLAAAAVML